MFESWLPGRHKFTYRGYAFLVNFAMLLFFIFCAAILMIILHGVQFLKLRNYKKLVKNFEKEGQRDSDDDSMDGMEEMKEIGNSSLQEKSREAHSNYEMLEKEAPKNTTWEYFILSTLVLASETITIALVLNILDLCVTFGYIHPTSTFFLLKYMVWIIFMLCSIVRYLYGCRRYPKASRFFENQKPIVALLFGIVFMGYTSFFSIFTSGVCLASHCASLDGWRFGRFQMSTAYMRQRYESTCPEDKYPCLTYITLPEDSLKEAFVNFHINLGSCKDW